MSELSLEESEGVSDANIRSKKTPGRGIIKLIRRGVRIKLQKNLQKIESG